MNDQTIQGCECAAEMKRSERARPKRCTSANCRGGSVAVTAVLLLGSCLFVGCANRGGILGVDCSADIPAGAIPEPVGTKVCNWQTAQVGSAIADQTVLYQADFVARTDTLSPAAVARISRHAQSNLGNVQPWIIEPSGDYSLDAQRLASATDELGRQGLSTVEIQIATPAAAGLQWPQSEIVARQFTSPSRGNAGGGASILGQGGQSSGSRSGGIF